MARDDFTQKTKDELAKQVAHICSNPEHPIVTIGPSEEGTSNSIGEAAHICAASKGGPRYDASMTREERKSIDNGIWLCANCAKDIDRDVKRFTVELLKQWKASAVTSARANLGKQVPSDKETINTLTTALSGSLTDLPVRAVSNVHAAVEQALQNLDSRFTVTSSRINGETRVGISANEEVSLNLQIGGITKDEFLDRYQSVLDHGEDIRLSSDIVKVTGSSLFETISKDTAGAVTISANKIAAKQKLWFVSPDKSRHETFDDIDGFVLGGTKSFSFSGSNCDGLFSFSYKVERGIKGDTQFEMKLKLEQWDGKLISDLPYFEKVFGFFKRLSEGWSLFANLEVDGNTVLESEGSPIALTPETKNLVNLLYYTQRARIVAAVLKLEIVFTSTVSFNQQQHCALADAADLFNAPMETGDTYANCSCTILADKNGENIRGLLESDPQLNWLRLPENSTVNIFEQEFDLPTKMIVLEKVQATIKGELDDVKEGDLVTIDWLPVEGFKMTISFLDQDA